MEKPKTKVLYIEIPEKDHKEIKQRALDRNLSIKNYILQLIMTKINWQKKYD